MSLPRRSSGSSLRHISQLQPIVEDEVVGPIPAIPARSPRRSWGAPTGTPPDDDLEPSIPVLSYHPSPDQWRQSHPAVNISPPQIEPPKRQGPSRYRNASSSSSSSSGSSPERTTGTGAGAGAGAPEGGASVQGITHGRYQQQLQRQIQLQQRQQLQQTRTPPASSRSPASSLHAPPLAYKHLHRTSVNERGSDSELSVKKGSSAKTSVTEKRWSARRGGWLRLGLLLGLIALLAVGLAVGLTVGLRKKRVTTEGVQPDSSSKSGDVFPAGSFAFTAALTDVKTDCTSNPDTWRCYPHQTYADSGSDSAATFFWIISPASESGSGEYQISSTENPFSATFENLALDIVDRDEYTERYTFEFAMNKTTLTTKPIPSESNSTAEGKREEGNGKLANCAYSETLFQATIWTRVPPQAGSGLSVSMPDFDKEFGTWPGQVEVWQKSDAGPTCVENSGGSKVVVESKEGECGCRYANFDLTI